MLVLTEVPRGGGAPLSARIACEEDCAAECAKTLRWDRYLVVERVDRPTLRLRGVWAKPPGGGAAAVPHTPAPTIACGRCPSLTPMLRPPRGGKWRPPACGDCEPLDAGELGWFEYQGGWLRPGTEVLGRLTHCCVCGAARPTPPRAHRIEPLWREY